MIYLPTRTGQNGTKGKLAKVQGRFDVNIFFRISSPFHLYLALFPRTRIVILTTAKLTTSILQDLSLCLRFLRPYLPLPPPPHPSLLLSSFPQRVLCACRWLPLDLKRFAEGSGNWRGARWARCKEGEDECAGGEDRENPPEWNPLTKFVVKLCRARYGFANSRDGTAVRDRTRQAPWGGGEEGEGVKM